MPASPVPTVQRLRLTEDDPEKHFLGWADEVDADALLPRQGMGISIVRQRA